MSLDGSVTAFEGHLLEDQWASLCNYLATVKDRLLKRFHCLCSFVKTTENYKKINHIDRVCTYSVWFNFYNSLWGKVLIQQSHDGK